MNELILADLGAFVLLITLSFLAVVLVAGLTTARKSKRYRQFVTDMYVAGKIKILANKDGVKITEEEEDFKAWSKKDKVRNREYNLDDAIEEDLIEKIEEPVKKTK